MKILILWCRALNKNNLFLDVVPLEVAENHNILNRKAKYAMNKKLFSD
jgi:hypothetical protein